MRQCRDAACSCQGFSTLMGASSDGQPMPSATLPAGVAPAPPNAALLSSGSSQPAAP